MQTTLKIEDHLLKSGYFALFTNGTKGAYFDQIYFEPIKCDSKDKGTGAPFKFVP